MRRVDLPRNLLSGAIDIGEPTRTHFVRPLWSGRPYDCKWPGPADSDVCFPMLPKDAPRRNAPPRLWWPLDVG